MADNVAVTAGTGTTLATDDIAGVHYPRTKLVHGADGVNEGDVSKANPLPVVLTLGPVKAKDAASGGTDPGVVILAQRRDADTTAVDADGDYSAIMVDENGRLKVSGQPASYPLVTGAITAAAQTVFIDCSRGSNVVAHMVATALVGHNASFEGSIDSTNGTDGTWFAILAVRSNANTIEPVTGVLAATPAYAWKLSTNGLKFMRVRAAAHTSGTATWKFQQAPYATEPTPAAQTSGTQPVSGTVTTNEGTKVAPTTTFLNSAATVNLTSAKATAGTLYSLKAYNAGTAVAYVKLYNKATAPVVASDVPVMVFKIPIEDHIDIDFSTVGLRFTTGIAFAITGLKADTDATAVAAAQVKLALSYI